LPICEIDSALRACEPAGIVRDAAAIARSTLSVDDDDAEVAALVASGLMRKGTTSWRVFPGSPPRLSVNGVAAASAPLRNLTRGLLGRERDRSALLP
jgi:hypothetical protein